MFFNKTPSIEEDKIVEQWSQLVLGVSGRGEEFLKSIARKIQEMNLPGITLLRKEATLGKADPLNGGKAREFVTMKHERYPDYELWIGAIDRAGQLKLSWYLTLDLPGGFTERLRNINNAQRAAMPAPMRALSLLPKKLGKMAAQKLTEQITGKPAPIRVRPADMTLDDREELGTYITIVHQAVLAVLEETMNSLNLDFSKVDTHSKGFLNLS